MSDSENSRKRTREENESNGNTGSQVAETTDERSVHRQHRRRIREQIREGNAKEEESWDKHIRGAYKPTLDNNGCRRWPWVRMPWSIGGYNRNARIVCDYWTYKEMLRRLPPEHPIHSITQLDYVDM